MTELEISKETSKMVEQIAAHLSARMLKGALTDDTREGIYEGIDHLWAHEEPPIFEKGAIAEMAMLLAFSISAGVMFEDMNKLMFAAAAEDSPDPDREKFVRICLWAREVVKTHAPARKLDS